MTEDDYNTRGYGRGHFVLGNGPGGTFGHVYLTLARMPLPGEVLVEWSVNDPVPDEVRFQVEQSALAFLRPYITIRSILLHVTITEVRSDVVRQNDYKRAVTLALYKALHKMSLPYIRFASVRLRWVAQDFCAPTTILKKYFYRLIK